MPKRGCVKVGYDTQRDANGAIRNVFVAGQLRRPSRSTYLCWYCGRWHIGHGTRAILTMSRREQRGVDEAE
jgi:hypothetical protein